MTDVLFSKAAIGLVGLGVAGTVAVLGDGTAAGLEQLNWSNMITSGGFASLAWYLVSRSIPAILERQEERLARAEEMYERQRQADREERRLEREAFALALAGERQARREAEERHAREVWEWLHGNKGRAADG